LEHVVASAKQGNLAAARFILDRVAPATSSPALSLDLPPIDTVDAGARAIDYLIQAVSRGEITLPEAKDMIELIKDRIKLIESVNFELRIQKVEQEIRDECLPLKFSTSVSPN
jgi:hypothetical protein